MNFTKAELMKLKENYDKEESIVVKGVNYKGDVFQTKGKISTNYYFNPSLYYDSIYLQFDDTSYTNTFSAQFSTNLSTENYFFILEIYDNKGNKIFENADKNKIFEKTRKNGIKTEFKNTTEGINVLHIDPVAEKLKNMIGKPVIIKNGKGKEDKGMFLGFDTINEDDYSIKLCLTNRNIRKESCVLKNTILETINLDGEIIELEDNNNFDLVEIWDKREQQVKKARQEIIAVAKNEIYEIADKIFNKKFKPFKFEDEEKNDDDDWWKEK